MPFVAKRSVSASGVSAEIKRLADYINTHVVALNNITAIATADATDLASAQTLSNANKAKINALLTALHGVGIANNVANITTADATNLATVLTLANANKAKINALLTALVASSLMSP